MTSRRVSRRAFLRSAGGAAATSSVMMFGLPSADASRGRSEDSEIVVISGLGAETIDTVAAVSGKAETVTLRNRHFPSDWDFQVGDRVVLTTDEDGARVLAALVETVTSDVLEISGSGVDFGGETVLVTSASVRQAALSAAESPGSHVHGLVVSNVLSRVRRRLFGVLNHPEHTHGVA